METRVLFNESCDEDSVTAELTLLSLKDAEYYNLKYELGFNRDLLGRLLEITRVTMDGSKNLELLDKLFSNVTDYAFTHGFVLVGELNPEYHEQSVIFYINQGFDVMRSDTGILIIMD